MDQNHSWKGMVRLLPHLRPSATRVRRRLEAGRLRRGEVNVKTRMTVRIIVFLTIGALVGCGPRAAAPSAPAHNGTDTARFNQLANLPFPNNLPSKESMTTLNDELLFQRATQGYLWALPAV